MTEATARLIFSATIDDAGDIHAEQPNKIRGRLQRLMPKKDRRVTVTVERYVPPKTNPQLGYYFAPGGVLDCWAEYTGYERDEAHKELKMAFLAPVLAVAKLTGEEKLWLPSLADLNKEQMSAYLDRVLREGEMLGIRFPQPEH